MQKSSVCLLVIGVLVIGVLIILFCRKESFVVPPIVSPVDRSQPRNYPFPEAVPCALQPNAGWGYRDSNATLGTLKWEESIPCTKTFPYNYDPFNSEYWIKYFKRPTHLVNSYYVPIKQTNFSKWRPKTVKIAQRPVATAPYATFD